MSQADVDAAWAWAKGYVQWVTAERPHVFGPETWYDREILQETLGITVQQGAYDVPLIAGHALAELARTSKAAYSLASRIAEQNAGLGIWMHDALRGVATGAVLPPKRQGKTGAENGSRDLIFKIVAAHLHEEYGLPLSRNDATADSRRTSSACEIIRDAFREAGHNVPSDKSIAKAIRRLDVR